MKIAFRDVHLSPANKKRLTQINEIIEEYQAQDYILTLRQLYYQLVSRGIIPNKQNEYAKLSNLLKEGRMSGIVDWKAIEDRLRQPESPSSWSSPESILDAVTKQYMLPRQEGQGVYLEVWVEKDALSGVLSRVTEQYHVPILVNRGYSSVSAMYESFKRFNQAALSGQSIHIIYLGDYDPSGIDMIRDIRARIMEFFDGAGTDVDFKVTPIALTQSQIKKYNPPPNPAKMTDPRAGAFVAMHGALSWEVDALRPEILNSLLTNAIEAEIDMEVYQGILDQEHVDKARLRALKKYL
jgi:hypothetical protein